jgi:hypothetical protein
MVAQGGLGNLHPVLSEREVKDLGLYSVPNPLLDKGLDIVILTR